MSTLIVTAHPDPDSLTHHVARLLQERLGAEGTVVAHLAQEGFDPRFTMVDRRGYQTRTLADPAVVAEQERVDAATDLVLVFPVWWWSLPALLKGWFDRVFITGWAFDFDADDRLVPRLQHVMAHLLPVSGTSGSSFARHGYAQAFSTQVEQGVLDYCGLSRGVTAFVRDSESGDEEAVTREVESAVDRIAAAITGRAEDARPSERRPA